MVSKTTLCPSASTSRLRHGLRNAGERIVIKVSTVVERLPEDFKEQYPEIEWVKIQRMRDLVAHLYDKVQADLVLATLAHHIPQLVTKLVGSAR